MTNRPKSLTSKTERFNDNNSPNKPTRSLSDARRIATEYVEGHRFLPAYVKPLAKEMVIRHFQSLSQSIAALELAVRRAEGAPKGSR